MSKRGFIGFIVVGCILVGGAVVWLSFSDRDGSVPSTSKTDSGFVVSPPERNPSTNELSSLVHPEGDSVDDDRQLDTPQSLLADYLMTGDRAELEKGLEMYPNDRLIMLQCALAADRPDSRDLDRLEAADPDNALPNLLRACLHAERGDMTKFKEELNSAMFKNKLVTGHRQRQAVILDTIIAEGIDAVDPSVFTNFDEGILNRIGSATAALDRYPRLFGNDYYETAGYSVALARKLRSMVGSSSTYDIAAGQMEIDILRRLNPNDEIGEKGQTIGRRLAELEQRVKSESQMMEKYVEPLMSSNGDPILRLKFFARVRSDGEKKAIIWLAKQTDNIQ